MHFVSMGSVPLPVCMRVCIWICVYCLHVSEFTCVCVQEGSSMCIYLCICVLGGCLCIYGYTCVESTYGFVFFVTRLGERKAGTVMPAAELATASLSPLEKHSVFISPSLWNAPMKTSIFLSENWRLRLPGAGDSEWLLTGTGLLCEVIRCSEII